MRSSFQRKCVPAERYLCEVDRRSVYICGICARDKKFTICPFALMQTDQKIKDWKLG